MAVVLLVGFGFAAQLNVTEFWASATYTLAIMVIATATVGALPLIGLTGAVLARLLAAKDERPNP